MASLINLPISPATDMTILEQQVKINLQQWSAAVAFLSENDLMTLPLGRHEITADGVYAIVQEYETKDEAKYEAHRKYIDIQCVVSGEEYIYVADLSKVSEPVADFDNVKDIQFFSIACNPVKVLADKENYVILFPNDAHMPCMHVDGKTSHIRKIVVKVPMIY